MIGLVPASLGVFLILYGLERLYAPRREAQRLVRRLATEQARGVGRRTAGR